MHLRYCAFTGPDDRVDPADLAALSAEYPFAEWALLCLPGEEGTARVPSPAWVRRFREACAGLNTGLHLCGDALAAFAAGDGGILRAMEGFGRIQLNLCYLDAGARCDPADLAARVKSLPQWQFVIQYGAGGARFLPHFDGVANHAVLFDASAGAGVAPAAWPSPLEGRACGYAGGIGPGNAESVLAQIAAVTPPGYETWIDMETGVRTNDAFDLGKVRAVLRAAAPYALAAAPAAAGGGGA